jgi:hypothetical protein
MEITFRQSTAGGRISVHLNDKLVLDDVEVGRPYSGSLFPEAGDPGPILLQDHGHPVRFRNVRMKLLSATADSPSTRPASDGPILARLAGTRWENTNGVTFEWKADGTFLHKGVERTCKDVGPYSVEIDFGGGHRDTLVFDADLTQFSQYSTKGGNGPLFTGRRVSATPTRAPAPTSLAVGESAVLRGHKGYVWHVAFSKDGSKLLTSSQQGPVVLWDVASRTQVWSADVPGDLRAAAFIHADRKVAVQRAGGLVTLDAGSGSIEDEARFPANGWGRFSPDGKLMALYRDGSISLYDVPTGREVYQKREYITAYAFSPTGRHCFAAMFDLYRLGIPDFRLDKLKPHQSSTIQCMDCSPDGKRLVTESGRIWVHKLNKRL